MTATAKSAAFAIVLAGALMSAPLAMASADEEKAGTETNASILKVCAAVNEAPYSTQDENGFENRIAGLLASAMGRKVAFVWSDKPAIYAVRDWLDPGKCDVVMGVDSGDPRVLTSKPYYRASYVFVQRKDSKLDITSFDSPDIKSTRHIAYEPGSPPQTLIEKLNLYNQNFNFVQSLTDFKSRRNQYVRIDPSRIVGAVEKGDADLGIAFAPEVARYVKDHSDLKMSVIPDNNTRSDGEKVPFAFDQSIAVRKGDEKLIQDINAALDKARPAIQEVLKNEGIPVSADEGSVQKDVPSKT